MRLNLNHALLPLLAVFFTALVAAGGLYSMNTDEDSSQLTGAVTGYKMFDRPSAKPIPRMCAQVITYACENRKPNNCRDFSNACLPPGWSRSQRHSRNESLLEPTKEILPTRPTVNSSKPSLAPIKPDLKKCLFNAKPRPCVYGRGVDKYGCRNCIRKIVR